MDDEYEAMDAAWDQQAQDERRRREDEALERCRPLQTQFRQELAAYETEAKSFWKRLRTGEENVTDC